MKHKVLAILMITIFFSIISCSLFNQALDTALESTMTAMATSTETPQPRDTFTPTITNTLEPTATVTHTPTDTPTVTPTIDPLSLDEVLEEIAIQESDLLKFWREVGVSTDGFVDGSKMVISPLEFDSDSYATWGSLMRSETWEDEIPEDVVKRYWKGYETERDFQDDRTPLYLAAHTSMILVFNSPEEAEKFLKEDTRDMAAGFVVKMETIGDESIAFRGWLGGYSPIGGVIWRYQEVYCAFIAQLKFEVAAESLVTISRNIQDRLEKAMQ